MEPFQYPGRRHAPVVDIVAFRRRHRHLARSRTACSAAYTAPSRWLLGLGFAGGDGVDANVFFDLGIALALTLGLAMDRGRWPELAAASVLPLVLFLGVTFHDNNFFFTRAFRAQVPGDIAFLKARSGPALCDQLSLCLWAGKRAEVDVFNVGEAIKTGARDPKPLMQLIATRHFATLQLNDLDALGPQIRAAIAAHYHLDHSDDNGAFLIPR